MECRQLLTIHVTSQKRGKVQMQQVKENMNAFQLEDKNTLQKSLFLVTAPEKL